MHRLAVASTMGKKSKKRSAAPGARHKGRPDAALKPAANPFEQLYARKKFDILGKRQKGGPQSKLQARSQANQRVWKRFIAKHESILTCHFQGKACAKLQLDSDVTMATRRMTQPTSLLAAQRHAAHRVQAGAQGEQLRRPPLWRSGGKCAWHEQYSCVSICPPNLAHSALNCCRGG